MTALAAVPSTSVALVVARSASKGLASGIATAIGIVTADTVFLILAVTGMQAAAEALGGFFMFLRYLAGAYLLWLGISMIRSTLRPGRKEINIPELPAKQELVSSFLAGFFLTLGDIKSILFYASLLPAISNPADFTAVEVLSIIAVTFTCVGGVKILYALAAKRISERFKEANQLKSPRIVIGGILNFAGGYVIVKG